MKKLTAILFLAFAIQSHGATMFGTFTNYLGQPDTNTFLIYRLGGATARADGTWVTAGLPTRITPQTNGYWETSLQVGNYMATNASLAPGIVFRVPDDQGGNSYSIWSNRLSGYNTFVTLVYGDNPPPTFGQITNALNGKPVFQEELDAAIVSVTNGFTTIVRSNASVFLHTNALPALTNGFVRSDITNLSATISLLNTSSNSLRSALTSTINTASNANHTFTVAATNGLARTTITNGLVSQAEINTSSNSLRTSLTSTINTASNQNHTLIVAATNGLARTTITNGLVSQTEINTSSNALRTSLIGTINTTSNALWQEIGTGSGGAGTNYVDAQVAASTNSLRTSLITVINSSSNANRSFAIDATNGLARLTDTNGFVRQANIDASSNSLRSSLVSVINTASNDTRDFAVTATNGLRHALSSAMTVTNLSFSGNPFMRRDTNIVAVYSAGNTTNNGTYVWESGLYRRTVGPGSIYFVNPTWFMEDGSATIYSASSPVGPWSIVSGSGPVPNSEYGHYIDLNGSVFRGMFVSTNFFYAVTNGFQSATNYARVATNVLNSNLTALINTASNANRDFAITVTNGFSIGITNGLAGTNYVVSAVNTASNSIRVDLRQKVTTTNITIGSDLVLEQNTNVLSVISAGTSAANGTYVWDPTGLVFTNTHTGSYVTNNSGDYVIRSSAHSSLYSSSTLITNNYTLGSGGSPSPTVTYGQRLDLSGMEFYGAIHSTNLDARIAAGIGNAASLNGLPGSAYVTNGGTASVTATNATHVDGIAASGYSRLTNGVAGVWLITTNGAQTFYGTNGIAITNAVNDAVAYSTVYIGPGLYTLPSAVTFTKPVNFQGAGQASWDRQAKVFRGGGTIITGKLGVTTSNSVFQAFSLQSDESNIFTSNVDGADIANNTYRNIAVGSTDGASTHNIFITGTGNLVENCQAFNAGSHGILFMGGSNNVGMNLFSQDCGNNGLVVKADPAQQGNVGNVKIQNYVSDNAGGLLVQAVGGATMNNVTVQNISATQPVASDGFLWFEAESGSYINDFHVDQLKLSGYSTMGTVFGDGGNFTNILVTGVEMMEANTSPLIWAYTGTIADRRQISARDVVMNHRSKTDATLEITRQYGRFTSPVDSYGTGGILAANTRAVSNAAGTLYIVWNPGSVFVRTNKLSLSDPVWVAGTATNFISTNTVIGTAPANNNPIPGAVAGDHYVAVSPVPSYVHTNAIAGCDIWFGKWFARGKFQTQSHSAVATLEAIINNEGANAPDYATYKGVVISTSSGMTQPDGIPLASVLSVDNVHGVIPAVKGLVGSWMYFGVFPRSDNFFDGFASHMTIKEMQLMLTIEGDWMEIEPVTGW
jgi:hypothetical protein